jgi:ABC-type Fe3+-siderophore transport system permease subunit
LRDGSHTGGEQWLGASTTAMQNTIANFLRNPDCSSVSSWQGQMVPLIFAAIPLLLGLIALVLSVLGLFTGSTNLVYAMAGRAAAAVDERRRRGR